MKFGKIFLGALLWVCPFAVAHANVSLNEIAWMGTAESDTNEWIELANDGANAIDLTGWRVEAEDGSPIITLSGTIAPYGYYLIERTDDTTVPGITADRITAFGSGLGNGGETLRLKDQNGTIMDTVVGGTDWKNIGGNNETKETAQRSANSWVTGNPTPRAVNVSNGSVLGANTTAQTATSATTSSTDSNPGLVSVSKPSYASSVYPREHMSVSAGVDQRGFVGLPVLFSGNALGLYDEKLPYASYVWNFGDGATGVGQSISHTYHFAGDYTVTLQSRNASLEHTDRVAVIITVPTVSISRATPGTEGFVELKNESDREVDISGWVLSSVSTGATFAFPAQTFLSAKHATIFPNAVTQLNEDVSGLLLGFGNGNRIGDTPKVTSPMAVTREPARGIREPVFVPESYSNETALTPAPTPEPVLSESVQTPERFVMSEQVATGSVAATVLWERDPTKPMSIFGHDLSGGMRWFFVLMGLVLLVLAGVVIARSRVDEPSLADEYAIINDLIEGDEDDVR